MIAEFVQLENFVNSNDVYSHPTAFTAIFDMHLIYSQFLILLIYRKNSFVLYHLCCMNVNWFAINVIFISLYNSYVCPRTKTVSLETKRYFHIHLLLALIKKKHTNATIKSFENMLTFFLFIQICIRFLYSGVPVLASWVQLLFVKQPISWTHSNYFSLNLWYGIRRTSNIADIRVNEHSLNIRISERVHKMFVLHK